ncbi:MAG: MFS transporter, partial [Chloroflexota bacterium]
MKRAISIQVLIFAIIRIVFNTIHRMIYPFLGHFSRGLGVDLATLSLALTGRSIIGGIGPLLGAVADSRGRKIGLLLGAITFTGGMIVVVVWPTLPAFFLALVLTTLGKYIFDAAMQAYLSDQIPYQRRGTALAVTESGWSLSFILGMPFVAFLIARGNWLTPFQIFSLFGVLIIALVLWMIPNDPVSEKDAVSIWVNIGEVLRYPPALAGFAIGILSSTANEVINLIFGIWLSDSFGLHLIALGGA